MRRPELRPIPLEPMLTALVDLGLPPGTVVMTVSVGQWDMLHDACYKEGAILLELDDDELPVAAYQREVAES